MRVRIGLVLLLSLGPAAAAGELIFDLQEVSAGDKLFVRPYEGPLGDFEVGGGPRLEWIGLTAGGWLRSRDAVVRVRGPKCQLPVGDYSFVVMTIAHENVTFAIQRNSFSDGGSKLYHPLTYAIPIRPGAPFVLDFSRPPQIVFAWPPKEHRTRAGERLFVQAVLIDPVLDFVVCGFNPAPQQPTAGSGEPSANTPINTRNTTLPPRVTISRANGEVVARGSMDYG